MDPLLLTWINNHMPSKVWYQLLIHSQTSRTRFSGSIFWLDFLTRYSDSIFRRDNLTRYSDGILGLDIRRRYSDRFSDSILTPEFWTRISHFIPHIIMDVITGLPQSLQKIDLLNRWCINVVLFKYVSARWYLPHHESCGYLGWTSCKTWNRIRFNKNSLLTLTAIQSPHPNPLFSQTYANFCEKSSII